MSEPTPRELVDRVAQNTGFTLEQLAERLGIKPASLKRIRWGEVNLSERNRLSLQELERSYVGGQPKFGVRETSPTVGEPTPSLGVRSKIRNARLHAGLTAAQLGKKAGGYPGSLIQNIELGAAQVSEKLAKGLVEALPELDLEELLSGSDSPRLIDPTGTTGTYGAAPEIALPNGVTARIVPRISYTQAGAMQEWSDDIYGHEGTLAIGLPRSMRAFALEVRGDSMEREIREGDTVIVLWEAQPHNGQVVVACTSNGEVMCKIYNERERGKRVVLTSYNAALHPPIELEREDLRWVYPVHSVQRQLMRS